MNALQTKWTSLGAREQRLVMIAAALVGLALLWWVALAPALQTLRSAQTQHAQVDAQLQSMRALAAEATSLRAQRALSYEESLRNLESSIKQTLGAGATLSVNDSRASLSLKGVSADALAQWMSQARINARVVPSEARLQRSASSPSAAASAAAATTPAASTWDGVLVLSLPAR
jgi:general secretion pathway protein M